MPPEPVLLEALDALDAVPELGAVPDAPVDAPRACTGRVFSGGGPVRLSVLMPVFDEERTIAESVRAVLTQPYPCEVELVVVDDGSTDRTPVELAAAVREHAAREEVARVEGRPPGAHLRVLTHARNAGKGAALSTAAAVARGTHLLPFDADLEYSVDDIPRLLEPVIRGRCDVVYGTRLFGANTVYHSYHYALGNKFTTFAANVLFNAALTDLHTCLKLVPTTLFRQFTPRSRGFALDTELTAWLLGHGVRPFEVPVSYYGRSHSMGKKITWRDGVACLRTLGRVRFARRPPLVLERPVSVVPVVPTPRVADVPGTS
ncbi:glycosyltransferase family 2 protein [Actinomycetospora termitidis]|uniref:Glycosyltransferase family 2 protein n=1 Tax=Actinomycetospora termitidis TaxID=3053470 RepID=A0ABT7MI22_9PSEU|nr:glycosyltransferase family 2 protein [Actinomycetospora sp. Odt1-22]MDL5159542.1 glycosyltransferase family 2 protein [Actinomycetospora sp. Odt1-22]